MTQTTPQTTPKPTGYVVYDGPSALDGTRIIGVLTLESDNPKTGDMAQLWILVHGEKPGLARKSRRDRAICGDCPVHDVCYVNVNNAPRAVWEKFHRGGYAQGFPEPQAKALRLGAYGDPAALPLWVIRYVTSLYTSHTGYTHQWQTAPVEFAQYAMASVESAEGRARAHAMGYRTARVAPSTETAQGEIICPATAEGGFRTTCENCRLCSGNRTTAKDIVFPVHGIKKTQFIQIGAAV